MVDADATCIRSTQSLENVESYIGDILVHTTTWKEHIEILRKLFQELTIRIERSGQRSTSWQQAKWILFATVYKVER